MYSIRRSCQSALRNSNGVAVYANGSRRAFSRSVARSKGGLPVFLEPSSTELSATLAKINSKVLLPEHLTREQQKLVYKEKGRAKLETEPVEVTVGDVTLPLEFIDRNSRPGRWDSLQEVINQSETAADWENLVRVLEGFHSAGIAVKPQWQELVVRKLNENGHQNIVLKALQRVKATGVRLSNYSVAFRTLKGAHDRAADSDWEMEETVKALRYARQVVELMEEEEHHAVSSLKGVKQFPTDWRSAPFVIAIPTELAAIVAQKHEGDVEVVKNLANRLVNALKQNNTAALPKTHEPSAIQAEDSIDRVSALAKKTEADFKGKKTQTESLNQYCQGLFESMVIWNALKTSKVVLGADMPLAAEAAEYQSRAKQVLDESVQALPKLQMRDGLELKSQYPAYIREQVQKCQA
ncbi:uncharacterized protein M421DRAFT_70992 [Didymella exigua CBS 183.55]|uniref:Uncharacterized protein n=1 Tax=Didymella exigua CBS 183.55 TaxID=1150837 RepID=A0A6A5RCT2_9PLEO|nr:uncharacterized protein M421DRAFT_70992 [Didymella exigua CBS 183.55]KAF1925008.1 hypothetical protein M421DRAFT_70992 [Didymella exigua CBS 183.55]